MLGLGGVGQRSIGWVTGALLGECWACRDTLELLDVASKLLGAAADFWEVQRRAAAGELRCASGDSRPG
jgi:hypothetical protein